MDVYSEFQLTLHSAMEETLQIQETSESLELLMKQAAQIGEKQQTLTLNIIDNLVEARMLPLGTILSRFPQMVQNLANVYGKQVELKLTGTDVLVDKAIAEKLYDPLLQLARNSFDHGIESPEIRRERGKSPQGIIEIFAYPLIVKKGFATIWIPKSCTFETGRFESKGWNVRLGEPDDAERFLDGSVAKLSTKAIPIRPPRITFTRWGRELAWQKSVHVANGTLKDFEDSKQS